MAKMTKTQIQERQCAIWEEMDKLEKQSREANGGDIKFTDDEAAKYDALVRESAGLSARAKALASDDELNHMRSNEDSEGGALAPTSGSRFQRKPSEASGDRAA